MPDVAAARARRPRVALGAPAGDRRERVTVSSTWSRFQVPSTS
jgi:hypothetical protein